MKEPGQISDLELGVPGDAEPLPDNDAEQDEATEINEPDEEA